MNYKKSPRAQIFARDQSRVVDLDTLTSLMRYNDYTHDPLSRCNCTPPYSAEVSIANGDLALTKIALQAAISTRGDLNDPNGKYELKGSQKYFQLTKKSVGCLGQGFNNHGALDYKSTNFELFKRMCALPSNLTDAHHEIAV